MRGSIISFFVVGQNLAIIDQFHERHKECISFKLNVTSHPESRSGSSNVLRSTEKMELSVLRAA